MASKNNGVGGIVAGKILGGGDSGGKAWSMAARARAVEDAAGDPGLAFFRSAPRGDTPREIDPTDALAAAVEAPFAPVGEPAQSAPDMTLAIASSDKFAAGGKVEQPVAQATAGSVFINEFNYDNPGTDNAEFVEIAAPAGTDLSGYSLVFYNGAANNGTAVVYRTINLTGIVPDQSGGFGTLSFSLPMTDVIQNGTRDGIALIAPNGSVIEFLSYEGLPITPTAGAAAGITSTDVGVAETDAAPDVSVQRTGMGDGGTDFTFTTAAPSAGAANAGQTFVAAPPPNTAPVAVDDSLTATEDTRVIFTAAQLLGNDSDADGNPLTIQSVAAVNGGSVTLSSDGSSVTFTPLQNFNGPAAFDYVISDGQGGTDTGRANVAVAPVNDAPTIANLQGDVTNQIEDGATTFLDTGRDAVITDVDSTDFAGGSLTVSITSGFQNDTIGIFGDGVTGQSGNNVTVDGVVIGTVSGGPPTPTLTITFNNDATVARVETLLRGIFVQNQFVEQQGGTRDITTTLTDGDGGSNSYTSQLVVTDVNDAPEGGDATRTIAEDTAFTFAASDFGFRDNANDGDGGFSEGQSLAAVIVTTLPTNGRILLGGVAVTPGQEVSAAAIDAGNLTFAPDADEFGAPYGSFTFQVRDNGGTANGGQDTDQSANTFTFNVTDVAEPVNGPTEDDDTLTGTEGPDTINALGGNDIVNGLGGDDTLNGDAGNDQLNGGDGNDILNGGAGDDTAIFNVTTDGADTVDLGAGDDLVQVSGNGGQVRLTFTSAGVGNGNPNDTDGQPNVRFQAEDGNDGLTGPQSRFDDEGITFVASAGQTFDVRDTGGAARGDQFEVVTLGTIGDDTQTAVQADRPYYFNAGMGNDSVTGGTANDFLVGGAGNDALSGGAGNDTFLAGAGDDTLTGGAGDDTLDGGAGNDNARFSGNRADYTITTDANGVTTVQDNNVGDGDDGTDNLRGIETLAFADGQAITGDAGANTLNGGDGNDTINGGDGDDTINGNAGNDTLNGDAGNDTIDGGTGNDTITGGTGDDTVTFNPATDGSDTVDLGEGDDRVLVSGPAGQIRLTFTSSGVGNGNPNDTSTPAGDGLPNVRFQAEDGSDGLTGPISRFDDEGIEFVATSGQTFDVRDTAGAQRGDQFEVVSLGTLAADVIDETGETRSYYINAGMGDDVVTGGDANDFLVGGGGNDTLSGGGGNDTFLGGGGNDIIDGGTGADRMDGGEGDDTFFVDNAGDVVIDSGGNDTVNTSLANFSIANNSQIENVNNTSNGNGTTTGNDGNNVITAGNGNDTINAGGGNDTVRAGEGDDTINGGPGNDRLDGQGGNDTIFGNDGNDDIRGGTGDDVMFGGNGDDFFRLEAQANGESRPPTGSDVANGEAGDDAFFFGDQLDADDAVNGGTGNDQIGLQGDYSRGVRLGDISNVEAIILLAGNDARFDPDTTGLSRFNLLTSDSNVAAGQQLIIDANQLREGENVIFNGSRETDGNFFVFGGMGTDSYTGGSGDDVFLFRNSGFKANDRIDGRGGFDQLGLQGDYTRANSVTFTDTTLTNVEGIVLLSATDNRFGRPNGTSNSYDLTTADGNVAAGQQFTVDGGSLVAGEELIFDGTEETDGTFRIFGGQGDDDLTGGQGNDTIRARGGNDELEGSGGNDFLDGEGGTDTARFNGNRSDYTITEANGVTTVRDNRTGAGNDGTDTLVSIERLEFRDVAIDASEPVQVTGSDGTQRGSFGTIQEAIDASQDGDTITIASGTYTEQLTITDKDNLTLVAADGANVTIVSPDDLAVNGNSSGFPTRSVIGVNDSDNVTIRNINVDGSFSSDTTQIAAGEDTAGISFLRSSGTIDNVSIDNTGASQEGGGFGAQRGNGLLIDNDGPDPLRVTVLNSEITDFQKTGVLIQGVEIDFRGNTISGVGPTALTGQNGIQIFNSSGIIDGNTIDGLGFDQIANPDQANVTASGILTFEPSGPLSITNNDFNGTGAGRMGAANGVELSDTAGETVTITGNSFNDLETGIRAVSVEGGTNGLDTAPAISGNTFNNNRIENIHVEPEQVDGGGTFTTTTPFNLTGSEGTDFLGGSAGDDTLNGLGGDDTFDGNGGMDTITGGSGDDRVLVNANEDGSDTVDLGAGNDVVLVTGAAGNIRLTFTSSGVGNGNPNDTSTPAGDNLPNVRFQAEDSGGTPAGPVSRFDDEGITFVAGAGQTFDVRDTGGAARGELFEVVTLGTLGDDTLTAVQNDRPYYFNAGMGNDQIIGGSADDFLVGGAGNDTLNGAEGNDSFIGGAGNDTLDGGAGNDTAFFSGNFSNYTITTDANGVTTVQDNRTGSNDGTDTLVSIERLQFADVLIDSNPPLLASVSDAFTEFVMNATPAAPDPIVMADFIV